MRIRAILLRVAMAAAGVLAPALLHAAPPLVDAPVPWKVDDRRPIAKPEVRDPNLLWDGIDQNFMEPVSRITNPGRLLRRAGTLFGGDHVISAVDINALDEVPNSTWFTNRIGFRAMTPAEVAAGAGALDGPDGGEGPDSTTTWTVVKAKTEGITPGFNIKDRRGRTYLIKFDDPRYPGMASAAGVITGRLLHAVGYNVPADFVVTFDRRQLVLGSGVSLSTRHGKRPMTEADVDTILARVPPGADGRWRAIASRYLTGEPVGPLDWDGLRKDDANDRVRHQDRRELRGLRMVAAWLAHFDLKQGNTLDMYLKGPEGGYLKHYLIDFASTLGAGAVGPEPTYGYEYSVDFPAIAGRTLALGLHQDQWRRLEIPEGLDEVGYFQSDGFDPLEFKGLVPNAAFANFTERDGYWAAKIISAFTNDDLAAAVATGHYRNPEAARWITQMLAERRDIIAKHWFDRVPPLDFFVVSRAFSAGGESDAAGVVTFHDLGAERGIYPGTTARYRMRSRGVDADRDGGEWSAWSDSPTARFPVGGSAGDRPFTALEVQVDRGSGWSRSTQVFIGNRTHAVVAVEH